MFGHKTSEAVKTFLQQHCKAGSKIYPGNNYQHRSCCKTSYNTTMATYEADVLVIALGADYDIAATPGLAEGGNEFYSLQEQNVCVKCFQHFQKGKVIVGVCSAPFKCPPAPSEAALLMHDYLTKRGIRNECEISIVMPFGLPIPPSPDTSKALLACFCRTKYKFHSKTCGKGN